MSDLPPKPGQPKDPEIAAAEWLLDGAPAPAPSQPQPQPIVPDSGEGFALADAPPPTPPSSPTAADAGRDDARQDRASPGAGMFTPSAPAVEQVWSRTSEWGTTLLLLAAWGFGAAWLLYITLGAELYGTALLVLFLGGVGAVLLSYPILITLERPVRVTPEQAARDYYGALSHHFPHYRRMWLLLSARGRTSARFASYEGFKSYWSQRLAQLREGHAGPLSPLVFQVDDFRAEKSAGKTEITGEFKVKVLVRGRRGEGPIWSISLERGFVRGPDKMWYLEDGTL